MKEYQEIRDKAEADGYNMTDEQFDDFLKYARRKAEVAGKDESYIPYLLPDVIKEHFVREAVNTFSAALMDIERYIKENTKTEVTENGRNHRKAVAN